MSLSKKTYNEKYKDARQKKSLNETFETQKIKPKKKKKEAKEKLKIKASELAKKEVVLSYNFDKLANKTDLGILQKEIRNIRGELVLYLIIAALIQSAVTFAIFKFLL